MSDYPAAIDSRLVKNDLAGLWRWLESESHLPGPRANLELLYAFCDACMARQDPSLASVLAEWLETPMIDAPVNSTAEFPIACAASGLAGMLGGDGEQFQRIPTLLMAAARSERWRTREAVAIGLQRRGYQRLDAVRSLLEEWARSDDPFVERVVLATLADTRLLKQPGTLDLAYQITGSSLDRLQSLPVALRKTEGNRVLEKALSYAISVFVAADPEPGFQHLEQWLQQADRETRRIINTNLGKARLSKHFPTEVARMRGILFESDDWER